MKKSWNFNPLTEKLENPSRPIDVLLSALLDFDVGEFAASPLPETPFPNGERNCRLT